MSKIWFVGIKRNVFHYVNSVLFKSVRLGFHLHHRVSHQTKTLEFYEFICATLKPTQWQKHRDVSSDVCWKTERLTCYWPKRIHGDSWLRAATLGSFLWVENSLRRASMKDFNMSSPASVPGLAHSVSATLRSTSRDARVSSQSTGWEEDWGHSWENSSIVPSYKWTGLSCKHLSHIRDAR